MKKESQSKKDKGLEKEKGSFRESRISALKKGAKKERYFLFFWDSNTEGRREREREKGKSKRERERERERRKREEKERKERERERKKWSFSAREEKNY